MGTKSYEQLLFNAIKNGQVSVKSVYDIWIELGNTGTPQDFINSLKGSSAIPVTGVAIPVSSWQSYNGIYKATISNPIITENDVVNVSFTAASIDNAIYAGMLGYTNTISGGFEIYSNFKPAVELTIDYAIINY